MKLRTIVRLMLAFVSLVLVAPLNSLPVSAVEAKPAQPAQAVQRPAQGKEPDIDGDGLSDNVEINGYDANGDGRPEVDYKKMGASPYHKDVFVEMDYMPGELASEEELDRIVQSFADLNISNPDGRTGINLHLDAGSARSAKYNLGGGNQIPHQYVDDKLESGWLNIKKEHFDSARDSGFHYMFWGDYYGNTDSSGLGFWRYPGFMVTVGKTYWNNNKGNMSDIRVGTFIHELGHNLNLQHGGADDVNRKPQYYSVMNYRYQLTGVPRTDGTRYFGYLQQDMPTLNEFSMDERVGLGSQGHGYLYRYMADENKPLKDKNGKDVTQPADRPIDFNQNGTIDQKPVQVDLNYDKQGTLLTATSDLKTLKLFPFTERLKGGMGGGPDSIPEQEENPATAEYARELDLIS